MRKLFFIVSFAISALAMNAQIVALNTVTITHPSKNPITLQSNSGAPLISPYLSKTNDRIQMTVSNNNIVASHYYNEWYISVPTGNGEMMWMFAKGTPTAEFFFPSFAVGYVDVFIDPYNSDYSQVGQGLWIRFYSNLGYSVMNAADAVNKADVFDVIDAIDTDKNVSIYPNPTTNTVTIETEVDTPIIQVYDSKGNIIINTTSKVVDLSSYPTGLYIFNVNGEAKKVFKK